MNRSKRTKQSKNKQFINNLPSVNEKENDDDAFLNTASRSTTAHDNNNNNNNTTSGTNTNSASTGESGGVFPEDIVPSFSKFVDQTLFHPPPTTTGTITKLQQQKQKPFVTRNTNQNQSYNNNNSSLSKYTKKSTTVSMIQHVLLAGVFGYMIQKHLLKSYLLPYGPAQEIGYPGDYNHNNNNNNKPYSLFHYDYEPSLPVDYTNTLLQIQQHSTEEDSSSGTAVKSRVSKIYERIEPTKN